MNPWQRLPLVRILPALILGIVLGGIFPSGKINLLLLPFGLSIASILLYRKFRNKGYQYRFLVPGLQMIIIVILAYHLKSATVSKIATDYIGSHEGVDHVFIGVIDDPPIRKKATVKLLLNIDAQLTGGLWKHCTGKVLVYVKSDMKSRALFYGDRVIIRVRLKQPPRAASPGAFDQRKYLADRNIFHVGFVDSDRWMSLPLEQGWDVSRVALKVRNRLLAIFSRNGLEGSEFAVAAALLLGYVDEIDKETMRDYSVTGAMHILSVSGMHVGVIFLVLDLILSFMKRNRVGLILKTTLIIVVIWFYAFLTGLSPAVMRAAVMISLLAIGKAMKRQPELMNLVFTSLLFLVVLDPTLLYDAGFQLSYLAVAGIILFYKPIYDLYITSRWVPDKIWSLMAVSIAAQMSTFPLSLHQFHQFPNYFMVTNLFVVPLSTLVIYVGILLLFFGSVPFLSVLLAKSLAFLVWLLNSTIHSIQQLPYAVTADVYINTFEMVLLFAVVLTAFYCLHLRSKHLLFITLGLMVIYTGTTLRRGLLRNSQCKMVVYGANGLSAVDFILGEKDLLLISNNRPTRASETYFMENIRQAHASMGIKRSIIFHQVNFTELKSTISIKYLYTKFGPFSWLKNNKIAYLTMNIPRNLNSHVHVDYLVIATNQKVEFSELLRLFTPKEIIVCCSLPKGKAATWKLESERAGVTFRTVSEEGAIVHDF